MSLNQITLQTLDSPKLRPLNLTTVQHLNNSQLRKYVETETAELAQLRSEIANSKIKLATIFNSEGSIDSYINALELSSSSNLTERQQLVREIQAIRNQKVEAVKELTQLRQQLEILKGKDIDKIKRFYEKNIAKEFEKLAKQKEKERKGAERKEAKKQKYWEGNIAKGKTSGKSAHERFKKFFDNDNISDSDKDKMRTLLEDVALYESDEVFKLLTLMNSNAFENVDEAIDFFNDYQHIQKGVGRTAIERFYNEGEEVSDEQFGQNYEKLEGFVEGLGHSLLF